MCRKNRSIKPKIRWKAKKYPDVWQGQHRALEVQQALIYPTLHTWQFCFGRTAFLLPFSLLNWGARLRISGGCPARGEPEALIDPCSSIAWRAAHAQRCTPVLQVQRRRPQPGLLLVISVLHPLSSRNTRSLALNPDIRPFQSFLFCATSGTLLFTGMKRLFLPAVSCFLMKTPPCS